MSVALSCINDDSVIGEWEVNEEAKRLRTKYEQTAKADEDKQQNILKVSKAAN